MKINLAKNKRHTGLSLVELIISMALMGMIVLSVANFVIKGTATAGSLNMRFSEVSEIQMLINDIQQDLQKGAYISDNSYDKRLEYTTYTSTGAAQKKIYKINGSYLQLSTDNGVTWISPYRVSPYDEYVLKGTPRFLYSLAINNCTDFIDNVGSDGVWTEGSDAAGAYLTCTSGTSTPVLTRPSQAKKVDLQGFQFSTGKGNPEATRALPSDLFISLGPNFVTSTASMTSPAVSDDQLVQWFTTTSTNYYNSTFTPYAATWDPSRERLIIVGQNTTAAQQKIYITDRKGVIMGSNPLGFTTTPSTIQLNSVAVKTSGSDILALDSAANKVYSFNLASGSSLSASSTLDITSYVSGGAANKCYGIAYDAGTPNDIYLVAQDASSNFTITQRNATTGTIVGTAWSLPAAFDASHPPGGLAIEPVNGDFIVTRNYVNGSGTSSAAIDIYVVPRSVGSTASFSVNTYNWGSTATVANPGGWGVAYEPITNHLFLTDRGPATPRKAVYEVIPSQLISPQS